VAFKELYNLGYTSTFDVTGREEITENLNLTVNPMVTSGILRGTVTSGGSGLSGATVKVYDVNDNPVYGKILEAGNRKPIVDAEVYLKSLDDSCNTMYKTFSNSNGQYLIYNILPNEYSLIIKKQGYLKTEMSYLKIEKYDRVSLFFDLIRYSNNSNSICGMITSDNIPIPKADVFLYEINNQNEERIVQEQMTNNIGLFLFLNVESGLYLVKGKLQNSVVYEKLFSIK